MSQKKRDSVRGVLLQNQTGVSPLQRRREKLVLCPTPAALQRLQTVLDAASEVARKKKKKKKLQLGSHLKSASSVTIRTPPNCRVGIRGRRSRDRVAHGNAGLVLGSRCRGGGKVKICRGASQVSPNSLARARTSGWDAGECAFDGLVVDTGSREAAEERAGRRRAVKQKSCRSSPRFSKKKKKFKKKKKKSTDCSPPTERERVREKSEEEEEGGGVPRSRCRRHAVG